MIHTFRIFVFITILTFGFLGCSATQKTSSSQTNKTQTSDLPTWYQDMSFQADSISFIGYGEAIASDSLTAINNAELQAQVNLESGISEIVEETRSRLSEDGNAAVNEPEFLIMLRNASQAIQDAGSTNKKVATEKNGYYKGFVSVNISKTEAKKVISSGFIDNQGYLDILNSSSLFE